MSVLFLAISLLVSGCATLVNGTTQQLSFQSSPEGATITIVAKPSRLILAANKPPAELVLGVTPLTAQLLRTEFPQAIRVTKPGYQPVELPLKQHISGWFFGNILLGGSIGSSIDATSGAGSEYEPDRFFVTLVPAQTSTIERGSVATRAEHLRIFIVRRHAEILTDLSRGSGEHWSALRSLLQITPAQEAEARATIQAFATRYPDAVSFATHVADAYHPQ